MGLCVIDCRVCPDFVNNFPGNCRSPFPVNVGGCFQQNGMQGQNFFELFFGWLRSFVTHLGFDVVALKGWFASIKITSCEETIMVIGNRLKELRESKQLSQGDIEKRSGLLRCYISRVENGHTVPAVETLKRPHHCTSSNLRRIMNSEAEALKRIISPNCAGYLRKWNLTTKISCCTWLKKSQENSPELRLYSLLFLTVFQLTQLAHHSQDDLGIGSSC